MKMNKPAGISLFFASRTAIGPLEAACPCNPTKSPLLLGLVLAMLLIGATSAQAANHYVRSGATGTNSGSDWINAYTSLPATLIRGDAYYIAIGSYGSYTFDDPAVGDQYITIKRATVSNHGTNVGWSDEYGGGQAVFFTFSFSQGYYDIDGVTGGGPGNWTGGFGIRVYGGGVGGKVVTFNAATASHLRLRHIDFEHNQGAESHSINEDIFYGVYPVTDILIQYCYIHDVSRCHFLSKSWSNITLEYSKIARNGTGIGEDPQGHREAWSGVADDNITIRYNIFEDIDQFFLAIVNNGGDNITDNWEIYGNVFLHTVDRGDYAVGAILNVGYSSLMTISNWKFYNNSIINIHGSTYLVGDGTKVNLQCYNNIWYSNDGNAVGCGVFSIKDYNLFSDNLRWEVTNPPLVLDAAAAASEAHGQKSTGSPFVNWVNGDYRLKTATNAGKVLPPPYNADTNGITRGSDGNWDRGAFEFINGNPILPPFAPKIPYDIKVR